MLPDPFPGQEVLALHEVERIMGMKKKAFWQFRKDNPHFPNPVSIGKTKAGKDILRWLKLDVMLFLYRSGRK
jgi:predicted DNA-binding transcriptional regulator AlpA